jgi:hypothetical protein
VENVHDPATYKEVVRCADSENWISAMHEEMQSLEKNRTIQGALQLAHIFFLARHYEPFWLVHVYVLL